jgi:DNA-binding MarR family transcriptional regulator
MPQPSHLNNDRILLGLLESVERDGAKTQRGLAAELGIALGLVNIYLKRCVRKGLVKMKDAPTRRYVYYLTPRGFSEKSRLTMEYLSSSFMFFRRAREACSETLTAANRAGWRHIALLGISDLAEIALLCAIEQEIEIVAVVDGTFGSDRFMGHPVVASMDKLPREIDGVLVTDLRAPASVFDAARRQFGDNRTLAPRILGLHASKAIA